MPEFGSQAVTPQGEPRCQYVHTTYDYGRGIYIRTQCEAVAADGCVPDRYNAAQHYCEDHCAARHRHCDGCDRHGYNDDVYICDGCDRCDECCEGRTCQNCVRRYHDLDEAFQCSVCDYCRRCCECATDAGRYHRDPTGLFRADHITQRKRNRSRRLIGFEFEFVNASDYSRLAEWRDDWKAGWHGDGSCGEEIVSAPIAGDYVYECFDSLATASAEAGVRTDNTCSLHVHVDASDYGWTDVYRLIRLYAHLEAALYLLGGQDRGCNDYCSPCGASYLSAVHEADPKAAVLAVTLGENVRWEKPWKNQEGARAYKGRVGPGKKSGNRYIGLNLLPWITGRWGGQRKGRKRDAAGKIRKGNGSRKRADCTIEFRIHQHVRIGSGRPHFNDAAEWCVLLATLLDWCSGASEADMRALPRSAFRTLCKIAPKQKAWITSRLAQYRRSHGANKRTSYGEYYYNKRYITFNGGTNWNTDVCGANSTHDPRINPITSKDKVKFSCAA